MISNERRTTIRPWGLFFVLKKTPQSYVIPSSMRTNKSSPVDTNLFFLPKMNYGQNLIESELSSRNELIRLILTSDPKTFIHRSRAHSTRIFLVIKHFQSLRRLMSVNGASSEISKN